LEQLAGRLRSDTEELLQFDDLFLVLLLKAEFLDAE